MDIKSFLKKNFENTNFQDNELKNFFINKVGIKKNLPDIIKIVHLFANDPLITQQTVLSKLNILKEDLIKFMIIILPCMN